MGNYAFTNLDGLTSYISSEQFIFLGGWSPTVTYTPPLQVVSYGNAMYIALSLSTNSAPPTSAAWSELVPTGSGATPTPPSVAVFTASGANHTVGIVPDPGPVAGKHNFLREDATWALPLSHIRSVNVGTLTLDDDTVLMSGSPSLITLPDATTGSGKMIVLRLTGQNSTIQAFGTQTIDVLGNQFTMNGSNSSLTIQSDGTQWWMISSNATNFINYAGPPTVYPPAIDYVVVDVNGRQWQLVDGVWV